MNFMKIPLLVGCFGTLVGATMMAACSAYSGSVHSEAVGFVPESKAAFTSEGTARATGGWPTPGEELWIIGEAQPGGTASAAGAQAALSGTGAQGEPVQLTVNKMSVNAEITGCVAAVTVKQGFANPYQKIRDARYEFHLPANAAVTDFVMTIGDRHIRAIIRERKEARAIYEEAKREGFPASLVEETEPNVFSENIGNIEAGKSIDAEIRYFHVLSYADGSWQWRFALAETGGGAKRSGREISLSARVNGEMQAEDLLSVNHEVTRKHDARSTTVSLVAGDSIATQDFVLRWKAAREKIQSAYFVERDRDGKGGTFSVVLVPPASAAGLARRPLDVKFVVDTSPSMRGAAMEEAEAVVKASLRKLQAGDRFEIIPLETSASAATPARLAQAMAGLEKLQAGKHAGDIPADLAGALAGPPGGEMRVVMLISNGQIGSRDRLAILKILREAPGHVRVLCVGVGPQPDRTTLNGMAIACHGDAAYPVDWGSGEGPGAVEDYLARMAHPALANMALDFKGMRVADVLPKVMPQVVVGRPMVLMGRFSGEPAQGIGLTGEAGSERIRMEMPAAPATTGSGLSGFWACEQMRELALDGICEGRENTDEIRHLALSHGLASFWTSFVVVDATGRVAGGR
jgi:Ca-activated chloride channel family protein